MIIYWKYYRELKIISNKRFIENRCKCLKGSAPKVGKAEGRAEEQANTERERKRADAAEEELRKLKEKYAIEA